MMHIEAKRGQPAPTESSAKGSATKSSLAPALVASASAIDDATLAVIGLALELESAPEASRIAAARGPSPWVLAGRARVLRGR
jgi:hypothetical protein